MVPESSAVQVSGTQLQAVLDSALDSIICMDRNGRVQEFNAAAEKTFGFKREEVLGRELATIIIPPELREPHRRGLATYLSTGEARVLGKRIEVPAVRADGSLLLVELTITVVQSAEGPFFTAYLRDITGQRQTERRRSAQYAIASLLAAADNLGEIAERVLASIASTGEWNIASLWLRDDVQQVLRCSTTWTDRTRSYSRFEEASRALTFPVGRGLPGRVCAMGEALWVRDILHEPNFPRAREASLDELRGAFAFPLVAGGRVLGVIEMFSSAALEPDDDLLPLSGALGSYIGQFIERQRTRIELERQKAAAEAANAAKDRFLAALSHELRTPLTPVLLWIDALTVDGALPPEMKPDLQMVRRNIALEARLIDDLLDLTRIGHGKLRMQKSMHDLHDLLRHAIDIVRPTTEEKQLAMKVELNAARSAVCGDGVRLQQVFWNLLRNACKFTGSGGEIAIRSFNEDQRTVTVEVHDNGVGISREVLERIFDPFEQAGREGGGGLGLGLAISKAFVELHGGTLRVHSEGPGAGATFAMTLETRAAGDLEEPVPLQSPTARAERALKILLVEDHESTAEMLVRVLGRMGHAIESVSTVAAAVGRMRAERFDLLVTDLGLPDGTGYDVLRLATEVQSGLRAIALSGFGQPDDLERSKQAGFLAHLTKPIELARLRAAIAGVAAAD